LAFAADFHKQLSILKHPATRCGESPIVKENIILYSLAQTAARSGECARYSIQIVLKIVDFGKEQDDQFRLRIFRINSKINHYP